MFNIAFPEFIVIAIVALIVIGPDKLPKVARTAGLMLGKVQRFANDLKAELNVELQADDLKKLHEELRNKELGLYDELRQGMQPVETVLKRTTETKENIAKEETNFNEQHTSSHISEMAEASVIPQRVNH